MAQEKYRAVNWTIHDGLAHSVTNIMLKDVHGFLWIATGGGLCRFDGSQFRKYFHDPKDRHTIAGNIVFGLVEDSLHNIWVGTLSGLSRYDIKADTFLNFANTQKDNPNRSFIPFWATRNEIYALESNSTLVAFNTHSLVRKALLQFTADDSLETRQNVPYNIYDSKSNSIWMLRGLLGVKGGGLLEISLSDGRKTAYSWNCFRGIPNHSHFAEAMLFDEKRNSIWINSDDGLLEFTIADKQFHPVDAMEDEINSKNYGRFVGIDMDLQGRIWLATYPKGIMIYNPSSHALTTPFPEDSITQKKVSEENDGIYCDRDGITWCSFWSPKGIYQLLPFSPAVRLYKPDPNYEDYFGPNSVVDFAREETGKIWMGTAAGLRLFNQKTGEISAVPQNYFPEIKTANIWPALGVDSNGGKFLLYADDRLYQIIPGSHHASLIQFEDSLGKPISVTGPRFTMPFRKNWLVHAYYQDKDIIFQGNWNNSEAKQVIVIPNNTDLLFMTTDGDHLLFLKRDEFLGNLTYNYVDGKWLQRPHPMDSLQWTSIFFNSKDNSYWVAGEKKIFHYDSNFSVIRQYTTNDGLPDIDITGLIADNQGNIWFHTDRSIHELDIASGTVSAMSEKDGFEKQYFELIKFNYKDDNGDIYFPGGNFGSGFDRISPGKYTNPPSLLYLQSLEINQRPFPLTTGINNLKELSLRYSEDKISIGTGIIDYYPKGKSRMRYMLQPEGKTADWQYGPAYYTIRFDGLQPGKYILRMQASTASLQFTGPEKVLLISISPPFWRTFWFQAIAIGTGLVILFGFFQFRSRNLRRKNVQLEEKVTLRTRELKHSLEELRDTQTQLIQREKMASLGELTAGIAHEIQNPLNFVNNFSDLSIELASELKGELESSDLPQSKKAGMENIVDDLVQNQEKINFHGKRADSIVKGMLQHSRASTGVKEPTDINALADEYLRLSYHGMRAKDKTFNAAIETHLDSRLGKINIIPQDIGRVLLNIYNNAFYAVNEKQKELGDSFKPIVSVSTHLLPTPDGGQERVEIRIRDNGMGIPQKIIDKIFQPFYTTKPAGEGTGLGLSLSYDVITKVHAGELKVETKEGEGAEFIIYLTMKKND